MLVVCNTIKKIKKRKKGKATDLEKIGNKYNKKRSSILCKDLLQINTM